MKKEIIKIKKSDFEKFKAALLDGIKTWSNGAIGIFIDNKDELKAAERFALTSDDRDAIAAADEIYVAHPSKNNKQGLYDIYLSIESLGEEFNLSEFPNDEYEMLEFKNHNTLGLAFKII